MPTDWILEPSVILLGCQAWPPRKQPGTSGCPVCGPGVREGDDSTYCGACGSLSPRREAQVRAARAGIKTRERVESAERAARDQLEKQSLAPTELERRRLWMAYSRNGIDSQNPDVVNRAKIAREWLTARGWEPDWSLILDGKGRVIGRYETPELV